MKREGKQHGMVRTYRILPSPKPGTRFITRFDLPPTTGLFIKVTSKPTNHSKFTGKCYKARCTNCLLHPISKSKNKIKGNSKHFQVMDQPGLKFTGLSAIGTLNHISNWYVDDNDSEEDESIVDHVDDDDDVKDESVVEHVDDDDDEVKNENNSCTSDEKEMEYLLRVEQVKEEKYEGEDWCLVEVECCS